jgi:hypothetical protein
MQYSFFDESLVAQHIKDLQRETEKERIASSIATAAKTDEKDYSRSMIRIFGLACFGIGLLAGSFLMSAFGLLPVVIAATCICVFVSLPVFVHWQLTGKPPFHF